jgi:putative DNA primase/helicase
MSIHDDLNRAFNDEWGKPDPAATGNGKAPAGPRKITIGSDIEIAQCVGADLHDAFDQIVCAEGAFWRWMGMHWAAIPDHELRCAVHGYDGAPYRTPSGEPSCVKLNKSRVDSVLNELGAILANPDFFAAPATGINCQSGFIRFRPDGKAVIEKHDREHRCRHVLPGHWQPGTESTPPESSLLAALLGGIFKGDEDEEDKLKLLQEVCGSAATGYATHLVQPKAVILKGESAENGKSQILDLARGVLPPSATATVTASRMGDERHIIGLVGKLLNASDELSSSAAISSDTFKTIVTGEPVQGRDVYKSRVEFRPVAQHLFATNALPPFQGGMDRGVQRRLLVVTFNRVIPEEERIENIGKRVGEEESDLLLAWGVEGASRLIRERKFTVPKSSQEALLDWLYSADPVIAWLHERVTVCSIVNNQPALATNVAYARFKEWAVAQGFKSELLPAINGFTQRIKANAPGIRCHRCSTGRVFLGMVALA